MQLSQRTLARQHDDHPVLLGVADLGAEGQVVELAAAVLGKEGDGAPVLKVVFYVEVGGARDVHHKMVERVVAPLAHADGIPAVATLHLAADADDLGGFFILLLLVFVLQFEQLYLSFKAKVFHFDCKTSTSLLYWVTNGVFLCKNWTCR